MVGTTALGYQVSGAIEAWLLGVGLNQQGSKHADSELRHRH